MKRSEPFQRLTVARILLLIAVMSIAVAACSSDDSGGDSAEITKEASDGDTTGEVDGSGAKGDDGRSIDAFIVTNAQSLDAKIIRDGSIDLRIEPGTFGTSASQVRAIAADLGGYLASGETQVEDTGEERYAFGWYTIRIPADRFDDAVARMEQLGERVAASLSSQDVTEEYVDLESRLAYWQDQEAFYRRLMAEATTIDDLVTVQTQMQEALLTIEQIEGRLRYLDSRTVYATLTVGLTEVPGSGPVSTPIDAEPGTIAEAFEQAGEVLLATVAFIIVSVAVVVPLAMMAGLVYLGYRLAVRASRPKSPAEGEGAA